jgi:hypothetical protein
VEIAADVKRDTRLAVLKAGRNRQTLSIPVERAHSTGCADRTAESKDPTLRQVECDPQLTGPGDVAPLKLLPSEENIASSNSVSPPGERRRVEVGSLRGERRTRDVGLPAENVAPSMLATPPGNVAPWKSAFSPENVAPSRLVDSPENVVLEKSRSTR